METIVLQPNRDFLKLIESYKKDCGIRRYTEETIRRYVGSLKQFVSYFPDVDLFKLSMDNLTEYLQYLIYEKRNSPKSLGNTFSAISGFYDFLIFKGYDVKNLVLPFRKRYLRMYKKESGSPKRKLLSIEEMSQLANSILDPRDKAIVLVFAKTGVRKNELLNIDIQNIDWSNYSILLKPTSKRSNLLVFFDEECAFVLARWLKIREKLSPSTNALFVSYQTLNRLSRNGVYQAVVKYAKKLGFHDSISDRLEDHFGPHCFRHWFTTHLLRKRMPREIVKELRGDARKEAIDIYNHIDQEELRRKYLACIPKLGI